MAQGCNYMMMHLRASVCSRTGAPAAQSSSVLLCGIQSWCGSLLGVCKGLWAIYAFENPLLAP